MRSRAQNGKARKIERKAASLRPSRPGGGKDRADLSIRFAIVGEGGRGDEEAAGVCVRDEGGEREMCLL